MKIYNETEDGSLTIDSTTIPAGHRWYAQALQEVIDLAATITAFDPMTLPANNLTLAIEGGKALTCDAFLSAVAVISASDGTYTYEMDAALVSFVSACDGGCDIADDTDTIRTLTGANVVTLRGNYEAAWEAQQADKITKIGWIAGAADVAAVNTILSNTPFGGLGPV